MISRRHWGVRAIVVLVSLMVTISASRTIFELWRRQDVLTTREQELATLEEENKALKRTLQDMGSESYIERVARDMLGMVKEGETIVILQNPELNTQNSEQKDTRPNWKRWWGLFF